MLQKLVTRGGQDDARPQRLAFKGAALRLPHMLFDVLRERTSAWTKTRDAAPQDAYLLRKDGIGIRLLDTGREIERIDTLISRRYRQRGYAWAPREEGDDRGVALAAYYRNRPVGTVTVNLDGAKGLEAEHLFGDEIAPFRRPGARLCEFTRLALEIPRMERNVLAYLFHTAFIIAYRIHRASDLFIEINPRHAPFYRRRLGFEVVGEQRLCGRVNAPALLLHKTLRETADDLLRLGGLRMRRNRSFYASGLAPWEEKDVLEQLRQPARPGGAGARPLR